jgi:hypothetical protein
MSKRLSLRKAINDKCKDCIYDELDKGNWRQQVGDCRVFNCPLYPVRPVSSVDIEKTTETGDL